MSLRDPGRPAFRWTSESADDPLRLLRIALGGLLLAATAFAALLWISGAEPRAGKLVVAFWAVYGLVFGVLDGVLGPAVDGIARALSNVGLSRAAGGFSSIETLAARGNHLAAAEAYAERARTPGDAVEATLRRAELLAGPLGQAGAAAAELSALRDHTRLRPADDLRVGLALTDLYEHSLAEPGRAMTELRRLIDRYPSGRYARRLRELLADLKQAHFGERAVPVASRHP